MKLGFSNVGLKTCFKRIISCRSASIFPVKVSFANRCVGNTVNNVIMWQSEVSSCHYENNLTVQGHLQIGSSQLLD